MHLFILMNKESILKNTKEIQKNEDLNGLEKIEDSVKLCLQLMKLHVMKRVVPARHLYPDPRTKEA